MAEPELGVVLAVVVLPFLATAAVPLVFPFAGERTGYFGAGVAALCFALLSTQLGARGTVGVTWIPSLEIGLRFTVDGWALLFAMLACGIGALVFAYSVGYMHGKSGLARYYAALFAFLGSILGIALTADLVALFLFWELTSVASFVLIGYESTDDASQYAARMAMLVTVGGGLFLLVGFLLLRVASGDAVGTATFDLALMIENGDAMAESLRANGLFVPTLLLLAVGAGSKSAQVPLHFWLPNAMAAPTPVSALLHSATMVKVGVYFVGRVRPMLLSPEWTLLFATVGLATMLITAVMAVAATDIKELLAYSTASHLGLMIAGFGFSAVQGAEAGVFHLLNHALFKAALFLVAGILAHQAGTRRIDDLSGLRRDLPLTTLITAVAALSMAGLPPFSGFYSKELLFEAAYEAGHAAGGVGWLYPAIATLASAFTFLYSFRFLAMFLGPRPDGLGPVDRPSVALLAPPAILAVGAGVVSVAPELAIGVIVQSAADATALEAHEVHAGIPTTITPAFGMTLLALAAASIAYPVSPRIHRGIRRGIATAPPVRANWWYDATVGGVTRSSERLTPRIHDGMVRTYASWLFAGTCALALAGYAATDLSFPSMDPSVPPAVVLVLAVAVVAAAAVAFANSHVSGVLTLSLLGFMVAIFYILASAPDLALTQLVVETLALLLFLLVLEELPEYYGELGSGAVRDGVLSLFVGATVFLTVAVSTAGSNERTDLARYFTEHAVEDGGGTNVVNVILTDFRGFDTLGEIVVLVTAALSVLTLVAMRQRGESP